MFLNNGRVNSSSKGTSLTFSGLAIIDPQLFNKHKFGRYDLWEEILLPASQEDKVTGELYKGCMVNINTTEDIEKLDAYLSGG